MATYVLGAQEGAEEAFASLYELTNPVLLRYLRVVSDGNPADLALTSWATLVRRLPSSQPDDDAWLEQVLGVARLTAEDTRQRAEWSTVVDPDLHRPFLVLADLEAPTRTPSGPEPSSVPTHAPPAATEPDALDQAIEALRALPADEAEVLAMRGITRVGRSAISRLTGHDAAAVVALLDQARSHVSMSHHTLLTALRGPARPDELADLPVVLRLFAGSSPAGKPAAVAAAAVAPLAATAHPSAVDLFDWSPTVPATRAARRAGTQAAESAHRSAWGIATAAGGAVVVGGVAAAAFTGLLPFGGSESPRPSAQAPPRPGPSGGGGLTPTTPGPSTPGNEDSQPKAPEDADTDDRFGPASLEQPSVVVVVPAFVTPPVPTPPTVVTPPPVAPPPPAPVAPPPEPPPAKPPVTPPKPSTHPGRGHAYAYGKGHPKHSTAKGHAYAHGKNGTQPGRNKGDDTRPGKPTTPPPDQSKATPQGRSQDKS
jgi:hypothetical protein